MVSPLPKFNKKYEREKEKGGREKMLNFGNVNTEILLPNSCCPGMKYAWSAQSEKKFFFFFFDNCGNVIAENGRKKINK